jgi:hypothetical protein
VPAGGVLRWDADEPSSVAEPATAAGDADWLSELEGDSNDGEAEDNGEGAGQVVGVCRGAVGLNPGGRAWVTRD